VEGHELIAKISDPSAKKPREGASYEGREVFVGNVAWKASPEELTKLFSKYGTVENVRMPRKVDGKSKGVAWIVFSAKVSHYRYYV
jgi:squamous cell carcinoma antigen recognized by T-cells 3